MRASRLLAILILLQVRGRMSASALAQELETSVRTIHRDIDELSAAGVPVFAERGRAGGFELAEGYQTRLTGLTGEEAQFLLLAGLGAVATDLGVASELAASQLKLAASLPPAQGARATHFAERFLFDPTDWYRSRERPPLLPVVAEAVWRERRLHMDYESWEKPVARLVDPLGIVLKSGAWYMVAASRGAVRTYRVSSITHAAMDDAPSIRPRRFRLDSYWRERVAEFEASLLTATAKLRLTPRGARRLAELSAAAAEALARVAPPGEGALIEATAPIESVGQATALFLRLGGDVEVLSPPELREALAREGARLVALYGEG